MRSRYLVCLVVLLCRMEVCTAAGYTYDYNENCSKAYQYYLSLHTDEARKCIISELKAHPYNLMAVYLADYEDCIVLLLNCDKTDYEQRADHLEERIKLLEQGDRSSPWYLFCKGGVYLRWAIINLRFGEQVHAALRFRKSFAMLKENRERFPQFEYNNTFAGLQEAVVGAIPNSYKWLAAIFGLKGSVKKGTEKLASFIAAHKPGDPMFEETVLYHLYTQFYLLSEQKEVWNYLSGSQFSTRDNLLNTFVKVNLALDYRKSEAAVTTLNGAANSTGNSRFPVFDYQMAVALSLKQDTACNRYFRRYLQNTRSDIYIKDCWQKMALAAYISGNMEHAYFCRAQINAGGSARLDVDKQAEKFAAHNHWPQRKLLQVRLLTEGGYLDQAFSILASMDSASLTDPAEKAEYFFRYGRANDDAGNDANALEWYSSAIRTGNTRHEQFAARAALQMGRIYERSGQKDLAMSRYEECLAMPDHDFQNSIDQQAKAGINRLEGR